MAKYEVFIIYKFEDSVIVEADSLEEAQGIALDTADAMCIKDGLQQLWSEIYEYDWEEING